MTPAAGMWLAGWSMPVAATSSRLGVWRQRMNDNAPPESLWRGVVLKRLQ